MPLEQEVQQLMVMGSLPRHIHRLPPRLPQEIILALQLELAWTAHMARQLPLEMNAFTLIL